MTGRTRVDAGAAAAVPVIDIAEPAAVRELRRALRDPHIAGVVLTGHCPPRRAVSGTERWEKPVVFVLSGEVTVTTLALACRCHARLAEERATVPTADLATAGLLPTLADLVGPTRTPELLVGDGLTADRLRGLGVVSAVAGAATVDEDAVRLARRLADLDPETLAALLARRLPALPASEPAAVDDLDPDDHDSPGARSDLPASARSGATASGPARSDPGRSDPARSDPGRPDPGSSAPSREVPDLRVVPGVRSGAQTRQKILDAAAHVIRTQGYTACRLSDIAKLCGTHQTSVYHYFPSKEALVDEVLRVGVTRTFDTVRDEVEGLPTEATALDRLAAAVRAHLRVVLSSGDYANAAMSITGELPRESYERIRGIQHRYGQYWSRLFTDAAEAGYLRPGTNLSVVRAFVAGALNYSLQWYDPAKGGADELADEFLSMILSGLTPPSTVPDLDPARIGRPARPDPISPDSISTARPATGDT